MGNSWGDMKPASSLPNAPALPAWPVSPQPAQRHTQEFELQPPNLGEISRNIIQNDIPFPDSKWPTGPAFVDHTSPNQFEQFEQQPIELSDTLKARLLTELLPQDKHGLLMLHERLKERLTRLKEDEMDIRKIAVKLFVEKPHEGMNTVELGNGFKLKAGISYNYNFLENDKVEDALTRITVCGNDGPFIAERLVKWTPSLSLTEYRILEDEAPKSEHFAKIKKLIDEVLVIKDGAPTLEIKAPKDKKS